MFAAVITGTTGFTDGAVWWSTAPISENCNFFFCLMTLQMKTVWFRTPQNLLKTLPTMWGRKVCGSLGRSQTVREADDEVVGKNWHIINQQMEEDLELKCL